MHCHFNFSSALNRFFFAAIIVGIAIFFTTNNVWACDYEIPACPFSEQQGRIIVKFSDKKIVSSGTESAAISGPVSVDITAGTYKVILFSYDGYASRVNVTQPHESWYALLYHGSTTITQSSPIDDLEDKVDIATKNQIVNENLAISQNVDLVSAVHTFYPDVSNPNSVYPVCAAFDSVPPPKQCSDNIDNDEDGFIDSADPTCHTDGNPENGESYNPEINDENSIPFIMRLGDETITLTAGDTFTDPGATAQDQEDGDITANIIVGNDTVSTSTPGTYIITYNVIDSHGARAEEITRTVIVNPLPDNGGNGGGGGGGGETPVSSSPLGGGPLWPLGLPEIVGAQVPEPIPVATTTVPSVPTECFYLLEYLKIGAENNPVEVVKLQTFLKNTEKFSDLKITGFFDQSTFETVSEFQKRYKEDILDPWGYDASTGYVYITTKKKINEIYCQKEFSLTSDQQREIAEFRALLELLRQRGITAPVSPEIGKVPEEGEKAPAKTRETVSTSTFAGVNLSELQFLSEKGESEKTMTEAEKGFLPAALAFLQLSLDKFLRPLPIILTATVIFFSAFMLWKRYKRASKKERILLFPSQ